MAEEVEIPYLESFREAIESDEGSKSWKDMCGRVREACESHGCFLLEYRDDGDEALFRHMKPLFDLPQKTKKKHNSPVRYNGYFCSHFSNLHQSFGINDAHKLPVAQSFSRLMWPADPNPSFSEALCSLSTKMLELNLAILKMVFRSFGMDECYDIYRENHESNFRLIKYGIPPPAESNDEPMIVGLIPHTDKGFLTILSENQVQGLQVLSRQDKWVPVVIPKGHFMVVVGVSLQAWSNGILHAVKHRVMIGGGNEERYSCGSFLAPKDDATIQVPESLVDNDHPLLYRPFTYADFLDFYSSNNYTEEALKLFAGV